MGASGEIFIIDAGFLKQNLDHAKKYNSIFDFSDDEEKKHGSYECLFDFSASSYVNSWWTVGDVFKMNSPSLFGYWNKLTNRLSGETEWCGYLLPEEAALFLEELKKILPESFEKWVDAYISKENERRAKVRAEMKSKVHFPDLSKDHVYISAGSGTGKDILISMEKAVSHALAKNKAICLNVSF